MSREGVVRASGQVGGTAVVEGGTSRSQRALDRPLRPFHELRRPREADPANFFAGKAAREDALYVVRRVSPSELGSRRRAWNLEGDPSGSGEPLSQETVLLHGKPMRLGQRQHEVIAVESPQGSLGWRGHEAERSRYRGSDAASGFCRIAPSRRTMSTNGDGRRGRGGDNVPGIRDLIPYRWLRRILFAGVLAGLCVPALAAQEATVQGRVRDDQGSAVFGASVQLLAGELLLGTANTDRLGSFRLARVPIGTFRVRVLALGYADGSLDVEVRGAETLELDIRIASQAIQV